MSYINEAEERLEEERQRYKKLKAEQEAKARAKREADLLAGKIKPHPPIFF